MSLFFCIRLHTCISLTPVTRKDYLCMKWPSVLNLANLKCNAYLLFIYVFIVRTNTNTVAFDQIIGGIISKPLNRTDWERLWWVCRSDWYRQWQPSYNRDPQKKQEKELMEPFGSGVHPSSKTSIEWDTYSGQVQPPVTALKIRGRS